MKMKWILVLIMWAGPAFAAPAKIPQSADVSVSGIFLTEPKTSEKVLGPTIKLNEEGPGAPFPYAVFSNSKQTESLTLYFFPGDVRHSFSQILVKKIADASGVIVLKDIESFRSGKNVQLGMSKTELVALLGKPNATAKQGSGEKCTYTIDNENSAFLAHYALPEYVAHYLFEDGKLVEYGMGFTYP